jgi:hypothetical protein
MLMKLMRVPVLVAVVALLTACDVLPAATPTPTRDIPPLAASPTFDIRPPTEIPANVDLTPAAGMNIPEAAAAPGDGVVIQPNQPADTFYRPQILALAVSNGSAAAELWLSDQGAPGAVLVSAPQADWAGLPAELHELGYTVLVAEMLLPGTAEDLTVMLNSLITLGTVDTGRIAVIGAEAGADLALLGCALDVRCATAILLSPREEQALVAVLRDYNPRPLMVVASLDDLPGMRAAEALRVAASGDTLIQPLESAGRGTAMLARRPDLATLILSWMNRYVSAP